MEPWFEQKPWELSDLKRFFQNEVQKWRVCNLYWGESYGKEGSAPAVCGGGAGEARKRSTGVASAEGAVWEPESWKQTAGNWILHNYHLGKPLLWKMGVAKIAIRPPLGTLSKYKKNRNSIRANKNLDKDWQTWKSQPCFYKHPPLLVQHLWWPPHVFLCLHSRPPEPPSLPSTWSRQHLILNNCSSSRWDSNWLESNIL